MSNIAEGFERDGTAEFVQSLSMARGSAGEVRAQPYVAFDQNYIDEKAFSELLVLAAQISRMINGPMNYLRKANGKGTKYNRSVEMGNGW
jgi:four helix bundle protein